MGAVSRGDRVRYGGQVWELGRRRQKRLGRKALATANTRKDERLCGALGPRRANLRINLRGGQVSVPEKFGDNFDWLLIERLLGKGVAKLAGMKPQSVGNLVEIGTCEGTTMSIRKNKIIRSTGGTRAQNSKGRRRQVDRPGPSGDAPRLVFRGRKGADRSHKIDVPPAQVAGLLGAAAGKEDEPKDALASLGAVAILTALKRVGEKLEWDISISAARFGKSFGALWLRDLYTLAGGPSQYRDCPRRIVATLQELDECGCERCRERAKRYRSILRGLNKLEKGLDQSRAGWARMESSPTVGGHDQQVKVCRSTRRP